MRRKLDITPSEMMELRNQGCLNHDIAKMLEVSVQTVRRYIGKQGGRMTRMAAFAETTAKEAVEQIASAYSPKRIMEAHEIGANTVVTVERASIRITTKHNDASITMDDNETADLMRFLVWASQRREAEANEEPV